MTHSANTPWQRFRDSMPIVRKWAFFDHAACSPLTGPAHDAMALWLAEATDEGGTAWGHWNRRLEEVRTRAAGMVGAAADEIALIRSTTEGITLVAEGFPWRDGDNVVFPADEFPTNQYAWMNLAARGVEARRVPMPEGRLDLDKLDKACDSRTRIVALSWVGYLSGWRTDLAAAAEMSHRHGALLFVDGIQSLGAFPLDVRQTGIDFFAAGGQKWLLGPEGTGVLYVQRDHLAMLRAIGIGSHSVVQGNDYTHIELRLKETAARYEGGGPNSAGLIALGGSLDLLAEIGLDAIGQRILEIAEFCCQRLTQIGAKFFSQRENPKHCSGIVTFELPGCNSLALRKHCYSQHVAVACRSGKLRISPHGYINEEDVDRLIAALADGRKVCGGG
jgi:cysteine desulfurase / selenocysteine lyase